MKVKQICSSSFNPTTDSEKENRHPNMMHQPKISSFSPQIKVSSQDWRMRVLQPSAREKNLEKKLNRMLRKEESPLKTDKIATQIPEQSKVNIGNTLWRYLYERSANNTMSACSEKRNNRDLIEELVRVVEDICGDIFNFEMLSLNQEETLAAVIDVLRDFSERNRKEE